MFTTRPFAVTLMGRREPGTVTSSSFIATMSTCCRCSMGSGRERVCGLGSVALGRGDVMRKVRGLVEPVAGWRSGPDLERARATEAKIGGGLTEGDPSAQALADGRCADDRSVRGNAGEKANFIYTFSLAVTCRVSFRLRPARRRSVSTRVGLLSVHTLLQHKWPPFLVVANLFHHPSILKHNDCARNACSAHSSQGVPRSFRPRERPHRHSRNT